MAMAALALLNLVAEDFMHLMGQLSIRINLTFVTYAAHPSFSSVFL
jgi:hypothetical protein